MNFIDAEVGQDGDNVTLTNKYGVKQAPTLVVLGSGDEYEKFRGVSEIKGMLTARQAV